VEHVASIFRIEQAPAFTLVSRSTYSSALKMEAACSSGTSVDFQQTTRRYIPEDSMHHRVRVFENNALKRIFGSKRDEVAEGS
jgi:hypothetical protein